MSPQMSMGDLGGEGSATAYRQNELLAGGDLAGSPAEGSTAPAQRARETDEDSSSGIDGSAGSRSDSSIIMAHKISLAFVLKVCASDHPPI